MAEAAARTASNSPFLGIAVLGTVAGWFILLGDIGETFAFKVGSLLGELLVAVLLVALPFILWRFYTAKGRAHPLVVAANRFLIATALVMAVLPAAKAFIHTEVAKLQAKQLGPSPSGGDATADAQRLRRNPYELYIKSEGTPNGMTLAEARKAYPMYQDMDDAEFSEGLYVRVYQPRGFTRADVHRALGFWPDGNVPR